VEILTGLLAVASLLHFGIGASALVHFALLAALVAVALIDWRWMIIPDPISLGFLALGLALAPFTGPGLKEALIGAVGAGGLLLVVGVAWEKARGVQAMGGGDVKLMAAVGAFLGLGSALLVVFLGAFLGAVYGVLVLRRGGQAKVAFGTFLAAAAVAVVFFGPRLLDWYLRTTGLGALTQS
jgi:leader peptidase (prepilin peptidase)/N-methyltransferase